MLRRCVPVVLTMALAGCGTMPFELVEREQPAAPTSLGTSIPPSMSMAALPPAAGSVVAVIERQRGNALQHEVTLHGAPPNHGENQILVTAFRNVSSAPEKPLEDTLPTKRPTEEDIITEMNERLVGGAVPISQNAPHNSAGAFAYAYGRRNGASCLYAWQWIEPESRLTTAPVSVRIRLCKPNATEEVLVDHVRQLYLAPRTRAGQAVAMGRAPGAAYGDALSAARAGGALGAYRPHPYGVAYAAAPVAPAAPAAPVARAAPARKVAAAPVYKRVLVRRVVKRSVVAPQIYSYAPALPTAPASVPQLAVPAAPPMVKLPTVQPARSSGPSGYSAVPMPQ